MASASQDQQEALGGLQLKHLSLALWRKCFSMRGRAADIKTLESIKLGENLQST
jgi:hypothetical protein